MTAPPALVARTTLVAEATWKAVLRRGLQAVAGGSTGWSDRTRSIGRSNFPLSGSNIPRSERPHIPWHLCPTMVVAMADQTPFNAPSRTGLSRSADQTR